MLTASTIKTSVHSTEIRYHPKKALCPPERLPKEVRQLRNNIVAGNKDCFDCTIQAVAVDNCTGESTIVDKRQVDKRREGVEREGERGATNKQNCDCNILNEPRASFLNKKRVIYITY